MINATTALISSNQRAERPPPLTLWLWSIQRQRRKLKYKAQTTSTILLNTCPTTRSYTQRWQRSLLQSTSTSNHQQYLRRRLLKSRRNRLARYNPAWSCDSFNIYQRALTEAGAGGSALVKRQQVSVCRSGCCSSSSSNKWLYYRRKLQEEDEEEEKRAIGDLLSIGIEDKS